MIPGKIWSILHRTIVGKCRFRELRHILRHHWTCTAWDLRLHCIGKNFLFSSVLERALYLWLVVHSWTEYVTRFPVLSNNGTEADGWSPWHLSTHATECIIVHFPQSFACQQLFTRYNWTKWSSKICESASDYSFLVRNTEAKYLFIIFNRWPIGTFTLALFTVG